MKYALVTGGSRGIGRAICVQLAEQGHYVIINYTSKADEAEKTLAMVREKGSNGEIMKFDVSNQAEVDAVLGGWIEKNSDKTLVIEEVPIGKKTIDIRALDKDNNVLFIKLSYQKGYGLPGGLVQSGETIEQALQREVFEETGLKVVNSRLFCSTPSKYKGIDTISIAFIVEVSGNMVDSNEGKVEWKKINEVINNIAYKDTKIALNKFIRNEL